jgi:periplasmic protein TonB
MKSAAPLAATLLLHLALIAAVVMGLSGSEKAGTQQPLPISVALLPPPPAPPKPAAPTAAAKPLPPPPTKRKHRQIRTHHAAKPSAEPAPTQKPMAKSIDTPFEPQPAKTFSTPLPAPQAQAAPAPAARTTASIPASYAAMNPEPPYPKMSQSNSEEGTVMLKVLVQPDGSAGDVRVDTTSGYPLLDKSARTTVQSWRFSPATINGKPIAQWYQVPIQFKLPDN